MRIEGDSQGAEFRQPEARQAELFDQVVSAGFEPFDHTMAEQGRGARLPHVRQFFIRFTTKETDTPK